jgi:hypothetical protein
MFAWRGIWNASLVFLDADLARVRGYPLFDADGHLPFARKDIFDEFNHTEEAARVAHAVQRLADCIHLIVMQPTRERS